MQIFKNIIIVLGVLTSIAGTMAVIGAIEKDMIGFGESLMWFALCLIPMAISIVLERRDY